MSQPEPANGQAAVSNLTITITESDLAVALQAQLTEAQSQTIQARSAANCFKRTLETTYASLQKEQELTKVLSAEIATLKARLGEVPADAEPAPAPALMN